jgi:hypothetical protein
MALEEEGGAKMRAGEGTRRQMVGGAGGGGL